MTMKKGGPTHVAPPYPATGSADPGSNANSTGAPGGLPEVKAPPGAPPDRRPRFGDLIELPAGSGWVRHYVGDNEVFADGEGTVWRWPADLPGPARLEVSQTLLAAAEALWPAIVLLHGVEALDSEDPLDDAVKACRRVEEVRKALLEAAGMTTAAEPERPPVRRDHREEAP